MLRIKYRSTHPEIMDDFNLKGSELTSALDKIAKINQFLGGNRLTRTGVEQLLRKNSNATRLRILDVGCGNGDMLRRLSDDANRKGIEIDFIGVDANAFTINYAVELSAKYPNISYRCIDVFSEAFSELKCDIILCTLTLHHFDSAQIERLLALFKKNSSLGFIVNDLHRSLLAYRLFQLVCVLFSLGGMSRNDGLVSILRGFKREELIAFSQRLSGVTYSVRWKWAFRYQWIVEINK